MNGCPGKIPTCERLSLNPFLFWKVKKAKGKQGQMTSHIPEQSQVPGRAGLTFFFFPLHPSHISPLGAGLSPGTFCTCAKSLFLLLLLLLSLEQKTGKEWNAAEELGMFGVHERSPSIEYFETRRFETRPVLNCKVFFWCSRNPQVLPVQVDGE